MKKYILVIVYLFQLSTPASAMNIKSDENIEIIHTSDKEVIYSVLNDEEIEFWHYDVTGLTNVPLAVAKPYLKDFIHSYKKIENVEFYTIENEELNECQLWVYYENDTTLAAENAVCDTQVVSFNDNKIYIPLKSVYISGVDGGISNSLISYDLFTKSITVEFDSLEARFSVLDDYTSYTITDIDHFSTYTIIKLHESLFERSWLIKLDKTHQATPNVLASGPDGYEGLIHTVVSEDKLYIYTLSNAYFNRTPVNLFMFDEMSGELEKIFDTSEKDFGYIYFYNYKNDLLAKAQGSFYRLENGDMVKVWELPENAQELYLSNDQILYSTTGSPFGNVFKLNDDFSSELLFERISPNRQIIAADNLVFLFEKGSSQGFISNTIDIFNQEEGLSEIVTLVTQVESPEILGSPSSTVTTNEYYNFKPEIHDPLGIPLQLTIDNKPSWAIFDPDTGSITGTPSEVSQHDNIIISVSNGYLEESLPAFSIQVLEAKSIEKTKSGGGAIFYLVFIIGLSYLFRVSTMRTV